MAAKYAQKRRRVKKTRSPKQIATQIIKRMHGLPRRDHRTTPKDQSRTSQCIAGINQIALRLHSAYHLSIQEVDILDDACALLARAGVNASDALPCLVRAREGKEDLERRIKYIEWIQNELLKTTRSLRRKK